MTKFLFLYWKHIIEPLGIMYLSAALKKAGHEAKIAMIWEQDIEQVYRDYKPDVIAGSIMTGGQVEFSKICGNLKAIRPCIAVMGGVHVTFHPTEVKTQNVDIIVQGEAEEAIVDLANAIRDGKEYTKIPNLWVKKDGKVYKNDKRALVEDLDLLGFPDREIAYEHKLWRDNPIKHFIAGRGCPYKCTYCSAPDSYVHTNKGVMSMKEINESGEELKVLTANGIWEKINIKYKRPYEGKIVKIKPFKMNEELKFTPNHKFFIFRDEKIQEIEAGKIRKDDKLCIPIPKLVEKKQIDILEELEDFEKELSYNRKVDYNKIIEAVEIYEREKLSTRKIAAIVGLSKSFVHQVISEYEESGMPAEHRKIVVTLEGDDKNVRFSLGSLKIPRYLNLDEKFMRLVGYYLAEGNINKSKYRSNSYEILFSFGKHEEKYINDAKRLVEEIFGIKAGITYDKTATRVCIYSNVIGSLFKKLFGNNAHTKMIPSYFLGLKDELLLELLKGYFRGDGSNGKSGVSCGTVSRSLAYQVFLISNKIGLRPSLLKSVTRDGNIGGRIIKGGSKFFTLNYGISDDKEFLRQFIWEDKHFVKFRSEQERFKNNVLLPIQSIEQEDYTGFVYNLEVNNDHTYTVNNIAVHNCFNHTMVKHYKGKGAWVRWRSPEKVVEEVAETVRKYGAKMIYFQDDTFNLNKPWVKKFAAIYKKEVGLPFHAHIRANVLDEEMAKYLSEAGCYSVHMAIECGNDKIRNEILKRYMTRKQIYDAVKLCHKYNIKMMLQNMVGLPTSTIEDDLETLRMNIESNPTYAWVSIFQPYPGVELTDFAGEKGLLTGDYNSISPKFFDDTQLKMDKKHKKQVEYLQKWFAVAANHPILYKSGALKLLINAPDNKIVKKAYSWVYKKYRTRRDRSLYGIDFKKEETA
jgi:radical SAM superfamily enzyme YgiQ (UPF0313 family)/intein/homing endonuclease